MHTYLPRLIVLPGKAADVPEPKKDALPICMHRTHLCSQMSPKPPSQRTMQAGRVFGRRRSALPE